MYDVLVKGGVVLDGTTSPARPADVGIRAGRVASIGDLDGTAHRVIDASGLFIAPGFIDIHSHSDSSVLVNPWLESKVRQGVTTEVVGNCGSSFAPIREPSREAAQRRATRYDLALTWDSIDGYLAEVRRRRVAINFATFAGHSMIRSSVMGYAMRPPTPDELSGMKKLLAESMEQGALGLSTGLIYPPSSCADLYELVELSKVAAGYDGIYASHIRNEGDGLLAAVDEAIVIGERSGAPVQISHHKAAGKQNWGKVNVTLEKIADARSNGVRVNCDQYPYLAASTGLASLLPGWVSEGGKHHLRERLLDPEIRANIIGEMLSRRPHLLEQDENAGWSTIVLASCRQDPSLEGKSMAEVAELLGEAPPQAMCRLLLENDLDVSVVIFSMCEDDVQTVMRSPLVVVGSDSEARASSGPLAEGKPHPRAYGTFPRVLGRYVRELGVLDWPEAVRKMTGATADKLRLRDRGYLRPGYYADAVLFNPDIIADTATYARPHGFPVGVEYVIVNGQIVVDRGSLTGALPGRVLRNMGNEGVR